jgi:tetratricopeptide (TPR) repeat protein
MMKRLFVLLAAITIAACSVNRNGNPYEKEPFYAQFLNTGSTLDSRIQEKLTGLRAEPGSAVLHNDLGALLVQKQFPKDAEREFERAINADSDFYPAWYNLGLVRASQGNHIGARRAFHRTVRLRKGHGPALFQLGLMAEKAGDFDNAVEYYAKAFKHNRELLDVKHNPRLVDTKLIGLALLRNYPHEKARVSSTFATTPAGYVQPTETREAPSKQAAPQDIITPSAPATDPATQTPAKTST